MKENRRRFRTALFGVIAAVVGIGWAAYFFLDIGLDSYRVREGITREQYAAGLERRGQEVTARLQHAQAEERRILELERRSADIQAGYQASIAALEERIAQLETVRDQVSDRLLEQARDALTQGDPSEADRLFARFERQSMDALAEAVYQRSLIAREEIRYRDAYGHARRAAWFASDNSRYLAGAGELARILGDHTAAKNYLEQTLAGELLKTHGEDHPAVATARNNLGAAWQALGEHEKAIGYFEQALAGELKTYGENHPRVATVRNHLGLAWKKLGGYEKAIGYYEQALAGALGTYGEEHPVVAIYRNSLGEVWLALGEYRKAIDYLRQALAGDLKTYGEDHAKVAIRRNNLGLAWQALGEHAKAVGYFERALTIIEKKLGAENPNTRTIRGNLAAARAGLSGTGAAGPGRAP